MPRLSAALITLTPEQEADLRGLARAHKTPRKLAEGAEMILRSAAGTGVREIARQLGVWPNTVRHWRGRWLSGQAEAAAAARLADEPRPGRWDVHARAGLRDRGAGLRTPGKKQRAAAQSLEPERTGPQGGQTAGAEVCNDITQGNNNTAAAGGYAAATMPPRLGQSQGISARHGAHSAGRSGPRAMTIDGFNRLIGRGGSGGRQSK